MSDPRNFSIQHHWSHDESLRYLSETILESAYGDDQPFPAEVTRDDQGQMLVSFVDIDGTDVTVTIDLGL